MSSSINNNKSIFDLNIERTTSTDLEEVVVCTACLGYGSASLKNSFMVYGDKIKNLKDKDTCDSCDGTGKLIKHTQVKFKPFDSKLALKTQITRNPENLI